MYCKNLRIRQKKYIKFYYCFLFRQQITLDRCKKCLKMQPRVNKGINKKSNKRITVTEETYNKVFERDEGKCRLANNTCSGRLELHHIRYRSEAKDLINEPTNCIMLCNQHHRLVHSNKHLWQPILKKIINN